MDSNFAAELWGEIGREIDESVAGDALLRKIRSKMQKGAASYADAYEFAWQVGEHTSTAARKILERVYFGETPDRETTEKLIRAALEKDYELIADAAENIQKALNTKAGIGLNAVRPPLNESRTDGLVTWLFDPENAGTDMNEQIVMFSSETVSDSAKAWNKKKKESVADRAEKLDSKIENYSGSVVTETAEANARAQRRAGLQPYITRTLSGKGCEFCKKYAGRHPYDENIDRNVFRRHDNCRCTVLFDAGDGKYTDVWTKIDYKSVKDAASGREKALEAERNNEAKYRKKKNIARDKGEKFVDATEYRKNKPKEYPAKLVERDREFDYEGTHYVVDGRHVKYEPSADEIATAKWWVERYGGTVELLPKVEYPLGVATPDYLIDGEKVDRKGLTGTGNNLIDNAVKNRRKQAAKFIVDVTNTEIPNEEIRSQAVRVMNNERRTWIQGLFIVKDGEVFQVLERP